MKIGPREIAPGKPPYIIAELGVNHDGSLQRALELVEAARHAGSDAVKVQWFEARRLMSRASRLAAYQQRTGARGAQELLEMLELSPSVLRQIAERARELGLQAIATVFSPEHARDAAAGFDALKVASPDVVNRPLIEALMQTGRPLLVSTGAAALDEVRQVSAWLGGHPHLLLHCVSAYPAPDEHAALAGRLAMQAINPQALGYSDHTTAEDTGALAVASGACLLEKHLTWDRSAIGPDHASSLDPAAFRRYVELARRAWIMLGAPRKEVQPIELEVREISRQSLTATSALPRGHVLAERDLTVKRPGSGIAPARLHEIVGRRLGRAVEADMPLRDEDLLRLAAAARAVVTGSRADFGLLEPFMRAVREHRGLELLVLAAGAHMLPPDMTLREVKAAFRVAGRITMQRPGEISRAAEAAALGRGVSGVARWLAKHPVDVLAVLGDRVEAFAAAAASSVAGVRVAHLHGGDRAPGIVDEALRHAITKLAHIHLPATRASADRIASMGEEPARIHVVGSPAIDGLQEIPPLSDEAYQMLGRPEFLFLLHPAGGPEEQEYATAKELLIACRGAGRLRALRPNLDPGHGAIVRAIHDVLGPGSICGHLPRREFIGLLRRVKLLAGNSSAGLIECAALGLRCLNVGDRQDGRERGRNVIDAAPGALDAAVAASLAAQPGPVAHPYGDGRAGARAAAVLAGIDLASVPLAKKNTC